MKKKFGFSKKDNFESTLVEVGEERVLYITLPYKGCTQCPRCVFCGVQDQFNKNLKIDKNFGDQILAKVKKYSSTNNPDVIVLYNGGNILRPEEMFQRTVLVDIPEFISQNSKIHAYELEVRADDVIKFIESVKTIKENLKGKKLRVRLGIEFFNDELLKRHRKGINTEQIQQAVNILNELEIEWNGYALLGGLDMSQEDARNAAIKCGKFMIDNDAYKVSINGVFITDMLAKIFGTRIYSPDYQDLVYVISRLFTYRDEKQRNTLFKVGFEEENIKNVVRFPYLIGSKDLLNLSEKLRKFNLKQNPKYL